MGTRVEDPRERVVQATVAGMTWPGETLLGFTQCRLNPGEFLDKTYYVGLTSRRFLLVSKDRSERAFSIYRPFIDHVQFINGGLLRRAGLELKLGGETILLETMQPWNQRAIQMVEQHHTYELESPYLTSTQFLEGITDLTHLGLLRSAQKLLHKHMAEDPVVEIEPRTAELEDEISQKRGALRLSLGTLIVALFYSLGRVIGGATWSGGDILPVILLLLASVQLVRWQQAWRGLTLGYALLAALLHLGYSGISGSLLNGIVWTSFGAANILALTGTPRRARNYVVMTIFAAGFLGPLLFAGITQVLDRQVRFMDDFSAAQGWVIREKGTIISHLENDSYAVHVQENNSTFFTFPPIHFTPVQVSFDAQVPDGFSASVGTYGATCDYNERGISYLVEIDPMGEHYAFLKHDGLHFTPISSNYWQPVTGTQINQGITHVEVSCAAKEMILLLNGIEQGKASVPHLSWFGKMGLFVRTWPDTRPQGFKLLFDNVEFQN